jgi:Histidine kinase-, DNA gyrase B-, and HSP90-like ATPase
MRRRTPTAGAGLGLSISRGIVAAHGGRIELARPERGSCFRIYLPVELSARPAEVTALPAAGVSRQGGAPGTASGVSRSA